MQNNKIQYILYLAFLLLGVGAAGWYYDRKLDDKLSEFRQNEKVKNLIWQTSANANSERVFMPTVHFEAAATKSVDAVVYVYTRSGGFNANVDDIFSSPRSGSGSGVIFSPDGYIITNYHVIEKAENITVTLNDKSEYEAKVVGQDPNTDLAVLKIDGQNLPTLSFANSDEVKIGQWVLAIGNPFNLTNTVTTGIVSAKTRNIGALRNQILASEGADYSIESFIQTDAVVNPGNSGGALVDLNGNLIGVNTAIATESGVYSGYSFAIPSNLVRKVVDDLITYKEVQRGFIGVNIQNLDARTAKEMGINVYQGALVTGLTANGAAKAAGVQVGDVVTKVQGRKIHNASELQEQVANYRPGQSVKITVYRDNQTLDLAVTLRNIDGSVQPVKTAGEKPESFIKALEATFEMAPAAELDALGLRQGVKVTRAERGGKISQAGIDEGFVITKVNDKPVGTVMELIQQFQKPTDRFIVEGYKPDGKKTYYVVRKK